MEGKDVSDVKKKQRFTGKGVFKIKGRGLVYRSCKQCRVDVRRGDEREGQIRTQLE